jgi:hypothetical protein
MPRPHEDLERHTPVDHRGGGPPITLAVDGWWAVEIAHVAPDRIGAAISTYETLIEKARTSSAKARAAAVLRSENNRRVIALIELEGHDGFRHLTAAWDDHHLNAERHVIAESGSLALYRLAASAGDALIDPGSKDVYAFERLARDPEHARAVIAPIGAAAGFRGALVFGTDDERGSAILYRFEHAAQIASFRSGAAAVDLLGPVGAPGESAEAVHPVKTFA